MRTYPFPERGSQRDREQAFFDFLAEQAADPQLMLWEQIADKSGRRDYLGHAALLLHSVTEGRVPGAVSDGLYAIAEVLLGEPSVDAFAAWLRQGSIDVPRLAGYLDHALRG